MFYVKFADIGEGIHEGVLLKQFYKPGDGVKDGDTLFTIETDKVNAEIPSPVDGEVKVIKFKEGDKVEVGQVIMIIDDGNSKMRSNMSEGEALEPLDGASEEEPKEEPKEEKTEVVKEDGSTAVVGQIEVSSDVIAASGEGQAPKTISEKTKKVLATPVARKMAKDFGIDIQTLKGSGPAGRVMKEDIEKAHAESAQSKETEPKTTEAKQKSREKHSVPDQERTERIPMTMLRKTIAQNMTLSKFSIPHTAVMDEIDVSDLVIFRGKAKEMAAEKGIKLTYLAFFIKAIVRGLKAYPYLNASLDETADEIVLKQYYNIGIAVDTEEGLMVPVIKNADQLSIFELADKIEDLSGRARQKKLTMDDLSGGSFTITNYGAVGASFGVPVIKHPEAGILGVGTIVKKPVVVEDEIVIRSILPVSLSFDHRIIDGADAGRFVGELKKLLSNPELLLLS